MKNHESTHKIIRLIYNYVMFFFVAAFLVSCSTMLFVTVLADTLNIEFTSENIGAAAKLTFGNVILLSALFTMIDAFRRKYTTEKITKHIADAAGKIVQGDFNVRIEPVNTMGIDENFNEIIKCFNLMAEELSGVETLRTDFIANVSHEMKTPLAVIQNYGTLLQKTNLPEETRREYAKGVADGSRRLADMMTNILKLNKLEKQQIYPKTEEYDLGEQLCECLLQFENVWENKNIEIGTELAEGVTVNTDGELLSLVWNNLFSNAFKFTPEGGKVQLVEEAVEFLKDSMEDIKESAIEQHKKDKESFEKIKAETKARHEAAIAKGKSHSVDIEAQIAKAKELGKVR